MLKLIHTAGTSVPYHTKPVSYERRLTKGELIPGYRTNFRRHEVFGEICDVVYKDTELQGIPVDYLELSSEEESFRKGFERGYHVIQVHRKTVAGYYVEEGPPLAGEISWIQHPTEVVTLDCYKVYDCHVDGSWLDNYYTVKLHGHMCVVLSKNWFAFIDPDDYPLDEQSSFYSYSPPKPETNEYNDEDIPF